MEIGVGPKRVNGIFRIRYKKPLYIKTPKEYLREKRILENEVTNSITTKSEHYDNLQQANESQLRQQKQPLKDATNTNSAIKQDKTNNNNNNNNGDQQRNNVVRREPESSQQTNSSDTNHQGSRSLQCLETLAQKAGIHDITADDCKYDIAHTLLNLDRGQQHQQQIIKQEASNHTNMSDIKNQQQQMVDANAQAQAQAAQAQAQAQAVQQQQMQQVALQQQQEQQQQMVTSQSPHQLQQVTVNASNGQLQATTSMGPPQQHTVSIHQQVAPQGQMIQTQGGQVLTTAQSGSTTITTMSPLQHTQSHPQQISADWSGRVQVIQQPIQNPTYLSQLYNAQGQLLMPSNIALHTGINPQQIQVITKPFNGNQLAPHMLTTAQGKQVIQGSQAATFPGYTQNQQTLVMGGQKVMQKVATSTGGVGQTQQQQGQCVQVSQAMIGSQPTAQIISPIQPGGQPMQFAAPWQFNSIPQVWATNGIQPQTLLAPNPIFIRGTQPDGSPGPGIFIQQSPQATTIQTQQNPAITNQGNVQQIAKPRTANDNIQPKQPTSRPLILPSNANNIRPASSAVSTQTIGAQTPSSMGGKPGTKIRTKAPQVRTSPALKADAANQTQIKPYNNMQQHQMVVMNTSTGMTATMTHGGSQMTVDKNQQMVNQNKNQQIQQQQPQQTVLMQQQAIHQQVQQQILLQQQQQQQQQQGAQQQHIQPKPMTVQTIQGIPQQQIQMSGDRPIMPVVSMSQANAQQVQQTLQQTIQQGTIQQCLPIQSNLAVTQQTMPMQMQQIQQQLNQMSQQGAIIGQIQAQTPQPSQIPQVTPNQAQMHQIQQNSNQQAMTMPPPQQVPLPSSVPMAKTEMMNEVASADSASQGTNANIEMKDTSSDATSTQSDNRESHSSSVEVKPVPSVIEASVQPSPIPATTLSQQPQNSPAVENGLPVAVVAEEVKERCPPKAMVKPQVLTHVIEDFVIHESSEPFPVTRSLICDLKPSHTLDRDFDEPPNKKHAPSPSLMSPKADGDMAKCEACGILDLKAKFKKNKRFCSVACSKSGKKDEKKKKWDKDGMEVDVESCPSGAESSLSPNGDDDTPKVDPLKWSVQEVSDFIKNLPGCSDYAEDFLIQEIDGQALMLLKEDHLMTAMSMKLGPALKIVAKIDDIRIDKEPPKS